MVFLDVVDRHQHGAALAGDEAPGFDNDAGLRELLVEGFEQRRQQLLELAGVELALVLVVLDAQAATDIDHGHVQVVAPGQAAVQPKDVLGVVVYRLGVEDLGAVIDVDALDLQVRQGGVVAEVGHCGVFFDTEVGRPPAHLPRRAGGGEVRVDADCHRRHAVQFARQGREFTQFGLGLDDDGKHPDFQGSPMFFGLLVRAEENDVLGIDAGLEGNFQFAQRTHFGVTAIRADQFHQGQVRVDLQCIEDVHAVRQCIAQLVETAAQHGFIVEVGRCPERRFCLEDQFLGKLHLLLPSFL
ncbi:hypothetical protein D9M71_278720 [compost metagenome]